MNEQQKARIVELADHTLWNLRAAAYYNECEATRAFVQDFMFYAERNSTEAFRIAQEAARHA